MKNILITGSSGFLSKELSQELSNYSIFHCNRVLLSKKDLLKSYIIENKIQEIIHTSWAGVGEGDFEDLVFNLNVYNNLKSCSNLVNHIFVFGSGCEFSETDNVKEGNNNFSYKNYYSIGKVITSIESKKDNKFINLRLFGCFGKQENQTRFIKKSINNILNNNEILIFKNKFMDFISVKDLTQIILHYINKDEGSLPRELNCVYINKVKLSDIGEQINKLFDFKKPINFFHSTIYDMDEPYTGCGQLLQSLNINLKGLYPSITELYEQEATNFRSYKRVYNRK